MSSRQFIFNLALKNYLCTLIKVMLVAEICGKSSWIITFINFNALDAAIKCPIRIYFDEKKWFHLRCTALYS